MFLSARPAMAEGEGPDRVRSVSTQIAQLEWWLISWADNQTECRIYAGHEGLPTYVEVLYFCGEELLEGWMDTEPCPIAARGGDTSGCDGYYFFHAGTAVITDEVVEALPPPEIWISLSGCTATELSYQCLGRPSFVFSAEEPLDGEWITAIYASIDGETHSCEGFRCEVPVDTYPEEGVEVEFWAESSFGDESEHRSAFVRALLLENPHESKQDLWQVDVLSDHWLGEPPAVCSTTWQAFPPISEPPDWLTSPDQIDQLATDGRLDLLAGRLLSWGLVEASACPWGGLLPDGTASQCGIEHSRSAVSAWQNRFDDRILQVAKLTGAPARLMKGLFAQESQFWPGEFPSVAEYGLGGLHENGSDALLLWNAAFYEGFCPLVLSDSACEQPYHALDDTSQAMLRGALAIQADMSCPDCEGGIDVEKADQGVDLFAEILLAGCDQVGQVVRNVTRQSPGFVSTYDDLWRYVLVNYNAGPGCLTEALDDVWSGGLSLAWPNVSSALSELKACDASVRYVERITQIGGY
jgi:hypothetical protein